MNIRQKMGAAVFVVSFAWVPITYWTLVMGLGKFFGVRMPRWAVLFMDRFATVGWKFHDYVLTPIFGAGTRGLESSVASKKME